MKIIRFWFAVFVISQNVGCDSGSDPIPEEPRVFISPNFTNVDAGLDATAGPVEVTAPAGLKSLTITPILDEVRDVANSIEVAEFSPGKVDTTFTYTFSTSKALVGVTIDIDFTVIDQLDRSNTSLFRIGVNGPELLIGGATLSHPTSNPGELSTSLSFYGTTAPGSYSMSNINSSKPDISGEIDFGYYYNSTTNSATLASPQDYPIVNLNGFDAWPRRNNTLLKKTSLTRSDFEEWDFAIIYQGFENGEFEDIQGRSSSIAIDEVIAFETDPLKEGGSKRGLILVDDLVPGDGPNETISLLIKFEK